MSRQVRNMLWRVFETKLQLRFGRKTGGEIWGKLRNKLWNKFFGKGEHKLRYGLKDILEERWPD